MPAPTPALLAAFLLALVAPIVQRPAPAAPATRPAGRTLRVRELPLNTGNATPQQVEWLRAFAPRADAFDATLADALADPEDGWRLVRATFPSPVVTAWAENNVVPAELYLPQRPAGGRLPSAVVLDILDGSAVIPRAMARGLAQQGVAALYVPMACYGARRPAGNVHYRYFADHPERSTDNLRQTVLDVRRAKALLAALPDVDPGRVGITGVSLGGIMAVLAAGVDGEFHRVVPVLAGGDIAAICFHARETRQIREACAAKGITQPMLADILRPVDPLSFAGRIRPDTCLMINASQDEVIPAACTAALNRAIGSPRMLMVPAGHYRAGLFLLDIRRRVADFFLERSVEKF